jgi:vancomycin permeability regulator SanA
MRRVFCFTRPLGVALALLILLNLFLALENPQLSITRIWLNLHFPEPELSCFASLLAFVLLLPHDIARLPWLRWLLGGVLFGFWILVGANVVGYYHRLHQGSFHATDLPLPFSLVVLAILFLEFARVSWWAPLEPRMPLPAWCFVSGLLVAAGFFVIILAHIVTFGRTDYRRKADAAVVLGAKVFDDGRPSFALQERLETAIELYQDGWVSYLIMSGGTGENGRSEPACMSEYAQRRGVPAARIILDEEGDNTLLSARNCGRIARQHDFRGLLTVSQFFHCARVKLIFERAGTHCYTVPTCLSRWNEGGGARLSRENFFLLREALAFPFYLLYYR